MILAGDIGGTNTRLALAEARERGLAVRVFAKFPSRSYSSLERIVDAFRSEHPAEIDAACFGVAGPVKGGRAVVTNLPWAVDQRELAERLSLPMVGLINDIQANAWGIPLLGPSDLAVINEGHAVEKSTAGLIAAGTGLGQAIIVWTGSEHLAISSEGGHADFAPRNRLEIDLLEYLLAKLGKRVSYERVLSGPGLVNIYTFLRDTGRGEEPAWLGERIATGDAAAEISAAAARCDMAARALEMFISIYGAATGNLALHFMATAGVYLGGGIAPKLAARLEGRTFLDSYLDKGRLSPLLAMIPVRIIINDKTALLGAAHWASRWMRAQAWSEPSGAREFSR